MKSKYYKVACKTLQEHNTQVFRYHICMTLLPVLGLSVRMLHIISNISEHGLQSIQSEIRVINYKCNEHCIDKITTKMEFTIFRNSQD